MNSKAGRPVMPGYERVHLNIPERLLSLLRKIAKKERRTLSGEVVRRLEDSTATESGSK